MTNDLAPHVEALQRATRDFLAIAMRSVDEETNVSLPQMRMLFALHDHGTVQSGTLAHILEVSSSSVTRLGDRLGAAGCVERSQDPANRSVVLLSLTATGREVVQAVVRRREREFHAALAALDPSVREQLTHGLAALHAHLSASSLRRAVVA